MPVSDYVKRIRSSNSDKAVIKITPQALLDQPDIEALMNILPSPCEYTKQDSGNQILTVDKFVYDVQAAHYDSYRAPYEEMTFRASTEQVAVAGLRVLARHANTAMS